MNTIEILKNNEQWVARKLHHDPKYFEDLAQDQKPEVLYIGCSDSRVTAEELMGAAPGEVFVHRNISNVISNLDFSAMSVINYAVKQLKVKHIIVCGHYGCGGVLAAMESKDLGILNPWLRNIRDVYRMHKLELNAITDIEMRYRRLVELNVIEQCINVIKTADVQIANKEYGLTVHGWVFDMSSGKLVDLNIDYNSILESIKEVYNLID
ncbi:MAG TPA: carbonic anhydrase [Flavobacteriaceae bacterium]|nr:carbonic anhydrase [Flavobacteriaceae bacterium]